MSVSINPSVSIIIPTYNEEDNVEAVIGSFLTSQYPNILEILVVDGDSTDSTPEIVAKLAYYHCQVKLLHNPFRIQSAALNIGLKASRGDVFLRADAHCQYASDYVEKCIKTLLTTKADNVGGAQRFVAEKKFQAGVALAANSLLGNGAAKYRNPQYNGYADTVFLGCIWTKTLISLSGYSNQITNEDAELNQRLLKKNPQAIYISSDINVWYYPRKTWISLFIQYFKYGRGRYLTTVKHKQNFQLRGKLPFLFISLAIFWACLDLFLFSINLYTKELFILGLVIIFIESFRLNYQLKAKFFKEIWRGNIESAPSFISRWLICGIAILTMPLAHFFGYSYQLFRNKIFKVSDW
ncbi:MAG: glycosyltransferase family 2 protein [Waterburya sp.]